MFVAFGAKIVFSTVTVAKVVGKASEHALFRTAEVVRHTAASSFRKSKKPSAKGTPPSTKGGSKSLPSKIQVKQPRISLHTDLHTTMFCGIVRGTARGLGKAFEFGGVYKGEAFDERPFMWPALQENVDQMPLEWLHSVGE